MTIKKITYLIITILLSFMIISCGKSTLVSYDFDIFQIELEDGYKEISPDSVENKQIINKIIKAYSKKMDDNFYQNILITKTELDKSVDINLFATTNQDRMAKQIIGYNHIQESNLKIKCHGTNIEMKGNKFTINNNLLDDSETDNEYYMMQYYYVFQDYGYIISVISNSDEELTKINSQIKKITCE